jgi:hypothetical protein
MAYFYFDFRDVNKQKFCNLLPSLLIQLSAQSDPCCDILSRLYSAHDRGARKPSDPAMVECLKEMLSLEAQTPTYIIIDALDECSIASTIPSPREDVLEFVDELVGLRLPNLHICVTSRPEHDIRAVLDRLTERPVSLHDESGQQEDIAKYVASVARSDQRMRRWREDDKDLVIKTKHYLRKRMECKRVIVYLLYKRILNLKNDIGSDGCFANWKSCGIVSHQVSGVSWTSYPTAWTKHTNASYGRSRSLTKNTHIDGYSVW